MKHSGMMPRKRGEFPMMAEQTRPDIFIQKMKKIRDHRLQIAEMELHATRQKCEASRQAFRKSIGQLRQAQSESVEYWAQSITAFYNLTINAKQFVARKCHHQQLKLEVAASRLRAREAAAVARSDRVQLSEARQALQGHRVQVEKLQLFKDISQSAPEITLT